MLGGVIWNVQMNVESGLVKSIVITVRVIML